MSRMQKWFWGMVGAFTLGAVTMFWTDSTDEGADTMSRPASYFLGVQSVQAAEIPQLNIYGYTSPEAACASVGGLPLGYGEYISGFSNFIVCAESWNLYIYVQGRGEELAKKWPMFWAEDFVPVNARKIKLADRLTSECGEHTFAGVANAKYNSSRISEMHIPETGTTVNRGDAVCWNPESKELYLKDGWVVRPLVTNLTYQTDYLY